MAYEEVLAHRLREVLDAERGLSERRMFGGLAFLIDGNMAVVASGRGGLMVRVDPGETARLLRREHVGPMVMRGKDLAGWVRVADPGIHTKRQLEGWARRGVAQARSFPPKR
jgi:hypothetical protein